jgi:hypothetical protein
MESDNIVLGGDDTSGDPGQRGDRNGANILMQHAQTTLSFGEGGITGPNLAFGRDVQTIGHNLAQGGGSNPGSILAFGQDLLHIVPGAGHLTATPQDARHAADTLHAGAESFSSLQGAGHLPVTAGGANTPGTQMLHYGHQANSQGVLLNSNGQTVQGEQHTPPTAPFGNDAQHSPAVFNRGRAAHQIAPILEVDTRGWKVRGPCREATQPRPEDSSRSRS